MKNIITGFALFMASVGLAAGNKMSMVTYFPVPYVAYSQVTADTQLDVGLTQNACNMSLGCAESEVNLKAHTVNLAGGRLDLNGGRGVVGDSISLGAVAAAGGQVKFKNVRINKGDMQSLNADDMRVSTLKLFGHDFPPCAGKGDGDGTMSWQPLTLQGASGDELYLLCGKPKGSVSPNPEPDPEPNDSCSDNSYYMAHRCECDPKPSNCCTQDWAEAEGMVFDNVTRTCKCPTETSIYESDSSYWVCARGLRWEKSGNSINKGDCPMDYYDSNCSGPGGGVCETLYEECSVTQDGRLYHGTEGDDERGICYEQKFVCTAYR